MDDARLLEIAEALEAENDLSEAKTHLMYDKPPALVSLANRAGFIRLAAFSLRAAGAPEVDGGRADAVFPEEALSQYQSNSKDPILLCLERSDEIPDKSSTTEERQAVANESLTRNRLLFFSMAFLIAPVVVVFFLGVSELLRLAGFYD